MFKKLSILIIVTLLILIIILGNSFAFAQEKESKFKFGFATYCNDTFWLRGWLSFIKESEKLGCEVFGVWGEEGFEHEIQGLETCIAQGVDVLVIAGMPRSMAVPIIEKAESKGIKCVGFDTDIASIPNVKVNDFKMAVDMSYFGIENALGTGNYVEFQMPGHHTGVSVRNWVFEHILEWYPDIKVVAKPGLVWPGAGIRAHDDMERLLIMYPNPGSIKAVWALWDDNSVPITSAIMENGRTEIAVSTCAGSEATLELMIQGAKYGCTWMNFIEYGEKLAHICYRVAMGEKLPWMTWVQHHLVTGENSLVKSEVDPAKLLKEFRVKTEEAKKVLRSFRQ